MSHISSYPSIFALGHRYIADIFLDPVLVEEKVDGSQFSFGLIGGEIVMKSKGAAVTQESPEGMFKLAARSVSELAGDLRPGFTYRCEYLQKPKHNTLCYGRVPARNMIVFDINTGTETYLSRAEKEAESQRLGLEIVPRLFEGMVASPESLFSLLENESVLGGCKIEGIVVKNYNRFGIDKKVLMGKYVSEAFKESHGKEWRANNPVITDIVDRLILTLKTEARWQKAVQHLNEAGTLEGSPRDIGNLIGEVKRDVLKEESEFIKEKLYEWAKDRIARAVTGGLPEWYKKTLVEKSFETTGEKRE
jgi:hypothetical protein